MEKYFYQSNLIENRGEQLKLDIFFLLHQIIYKSSVISANFLRSDRKY